MKLISLTTICIGLAFHISTAVATQYEHVLGETYDVLERNPSDEIKDIAGTKDWKAIYEKGLDLKFPEPTIARATRNNEFVHEVLNTIDMDVRNPNTGQILYPKGYTFNPLAYLGAMKLPTFIVVSNHEKDIEWLQQQNITPNTMILSVDDPLGLSKKINHKVMLLKDDLREKLKINFYPAIAQQVGVKIKVNEYHVSL